MDSLRAQRAFSLIELMVTVAVIAILAAVAAPSMQSFLDKNRLVGAAEAVYGQVQMARSEAVKQSANMVMVFAPGGSWCAGFARDDGSDCDCSVTDPTADGACSILADGATAVLRRLASAGYSGVTMDDGAPASITINGVRGTAGADTAIDFQSELGRQLRVEVNALGRARLCSPAGAGAVGGYPAC